MIISNNNSGLCNRIKCWASSVRIDANCFVDWPQSTNVRYKDISYPSFDALFENKNFIESNVSFTKRTIYDRPDDIFKKGIDYSQNTLKYYRSPYLAVLPQDNVSRDFIKNGFSEKTIIDHQYNRTPENVKEAYLKIFNKIKIKNNIVEKANYFIDKEIKNKKLVTVHVRSFCDSLDRKKKWYDIQNFINKMKDVDDDGVQFFIAVDDFKIIDDFKCVFKDKIVYYPKEKDPAIDMGSYNSQVEALIDLLILGRGNIFLATETSTFSEVAWWLGGCKSAVYKIGNIIYE